MLHRASRENHASLVVDLRNGRLRVHRHGGTGELELVADHNDEFDLVRLPDGSIRTQWDESGAGDDSTQRMRFINLVQRSNSLSPSVNLGAVYFPLIRGLCADALEGCQTAPRVPLHYLIHFNSHESLWSALPTEPFHAGDRVIVPSRFIDELLMLFTEVGRRVSAVHAAAPIDVFAFFKLHQVPTACRISVSRADGNLVARPREVFPAHRPPAQGFPELRPWSILVLGNLAEVSESLVDFTDFMHGTGAKACTSEILGTISTTAMLVECFPRGKCHGGEDVTLVLDRYFGIMDGPDDWWVTISNPAEFPAAETRTVHADRAENRPGISFFRGYFSDPQYCYRFGPVALDQEEAEDAVRINMILDDHVSAHIEIIGFQKENKQPAELCIRHLNAPSLSLGVRSHEC